MTGARGVLIATHECGMCDSPLRFIGLDDERVPQWACTSCSWFHSSRDCCWGEVQG